jgi:hypothetical protein
VLRDEIKQPDFNSIQILAGQLLAVLAYARTAPPSIPPSYQRVIEVIVECLRDLHDNYAPEDK